MSGRQAGEQAFEAAARRLVLTHRCPPWSRRWPPRPTAFGGPVEQAEIGKEFVL